MAKTSDEECRHCHETIHVPLTDYVEGKQIACPHCKKHSTFIRVASPSQKNLGARVWYLRPD